MSNNSGRERLLQNVEDIAAKDHANTTEDLEDAPADSTRHSTESSSDSTVQSAEYATAQSRTDSTTPLAESSMESATQETPAADPGGDDRSSRSPAPDGGVDGKTPAARALNESILGVQERWLEAEERRRLYGDPVYVPSPPRTWDDLRTDIVYSRCYQTFGSLLLYAGYFSLVASLVYILFFASHHPQQSGSTETRYQWQKKVMEAKRRMTYPEPCRVLVNEFADAFSQFMACMTRNARPLRVCTKCAFERWKVEQTYYDIDHGTSKSNRNCRYEVLGQTDIEVLTFNYDFYKRAMEINGCDLCTTKLGVNGYMVNEDVVNYIDSHTDFLVCMNANWDKTLPSNSSQSAARSAGGTDNVSSGAAPAPASAACSACRRLVQLQGRLLQSVTGRAFHPVSTDVTCADVVDAANETYRLWHCSGCPLPPQIDFNSDHKPWSYYLVNLSGVIMLAMFFATWAVYARCRRARAPVVAARPAVRGGGAAAGWRQRVPAEAITRRRCVRRPH